MQCSVKFVKADASGRRRATAGGNLSSSRGRRESWSKPRVERRLRRWAARRRDGSPVVQRRLYFIVGRGGCDACDPDQEATENFTDDGDDNGVVSGDILTAQFCTAVKSVYPIQPCKGVQLCLDEYIDWMNCVYSDICEEELTCEDEGMADDRCEGMLIWCDSANACTFPTSGAGGCPEFGSQFDNDDSAGGDDDHSGHDHDEGHSSDGATSTTPAVLVAALAALAYA